MNKVKEHIRIIFFLLAGLVLLLHSTISHHHHFYSYHHTAYCSSANATGSDTDAKNTDCHAFNTIIINNVNSLSSNLKPAITFVLFYADRYCKLSINRELGFDFNTTYNIVYRRQYLFSGIGLRGPPSFV